MAEKRFGKGCFKAGEAFFGHQRFLVLRVSDFFLRRFNAMAQKVFRSKYFVENATIGFEEGFSLNRSRRKFTHGSVKSTFTERGKPT